MEDVIWVIFIGNNFYYESGTVMSSLYKIVSGGYERYDWGFAERDLADGKSIRIRPADEQEMAIFNAELAELLAQRKEK